MPSMDKKLVAVVPDVHVPDHDPEAVRWCLQQIKHRRPGTVVLLGDVLDLTSVSRFPKSLATKATLVSELEAGREFFSQLLSAAKDARIIYKSGNHEDRLSTYLFKAAPELADLPALTIPAVLKLPPRVEYVSTHHVIVDDVMVTHGRKFDGNVALANLRRYRMSVVQGHSHRMTIAYLCDARGNLLSSAECGTLQIKTPGYAGVTDWTHGLAWIRNGVVLLQPKEDQ